MDGEWGVVESEDIFGALFGWVDRNSQCVS